MVFRTMLKRRTCGQPKRKRSDTGNHLDRESFGRFAQTRGQGPGGGICPGMSAPVDDHPRIAAGLQLNALRCRSVCEASCAGPLGCGRIGLT